MTIAAGFLCSDGVVVAADRQITSPTYTFPECKLSSFYWGNGRGILAYAGNRDAHVEFDKQLWVRFPCNADIDAQDMPRILEEALKAAIQKKESFAAFFGFWIDQRPLPSLLMISAQGIGNVRVTDVQEFEVIGCADSPLSRFLLGNLQASGGRSMTVHQAMIYAVRIIGASEVYDGQFVGGGIDAMSVSHRPDIGKLGVGVLDHGRSKEWQEEIRLMDYWSEVLFRELTDSKKELDMGQFMEEVKRFRAWVCGDLAK
jgi:hypothetical protein